MASSQPPLGNHNFQVVISGDPKIAAGFSDVSGLSTEINYSDYRAGDSKTTAIGKVPNTSKTGEVSFKRGLTSGMELFEWFEGVRQQKYDPRTITVQVLSGGQPTATYTLSTCWPKSYVGPTLAGKGGGDVAIEELKVVCEELRFGQ
jgi:phage tail-like protein